MGIIFEVRGERGERREEREIESEIEREQKFHFRVLSNAKRRYCRFA
jgi:hypothetical protein